MMKMILAVVAVADLVGLVVVVAFRKRAYKCWARKQGGSDIGEA